MKLHWMSSLVLAAAVAVPSFAQVSIYIGTPPPPIRYEAPPPAPGPNFVWIEGYWAPQGHHYKWVAGRWDRAPYPGAYWVHPHYDHYDEGWQMHEGYWSHENHDNGHWKDHDNGHGHDHDDDHDHGH
jgi:hypothetical protein